MILVDSNIPMYLVGADHPNRASARRALDALIADRTRLVTDAEVFQEILHRFRAIRRRDAIQPAWDVLDAICDEVLSVEYRDVDAARDVLLGRWELSSRDALHVAIMRRHKIDTVLTFDTGFDAIPGLTRLP